MFIKLSCKTGDAYRRAKQHYKTWAIEREKVIMDLTDLKNEIQKLSESIASDSIKYSGLGLVATGMTAAGFLAPFTFGVSVAIATIGTGVSVTSGLVSFYKERGKLNTIKELCSKVESMLEEHDKTGIEMQRVFDRLEKDIVSSFVTGNGKKYINDVREQEERKSKVVGAFSKACQVATYSKVEKYVRITRIVKDAPKMIKVGKTLRTVQRIKISKLSVGVSKVSKGLSTLAAVGVIIDIGTIISSARDLSKFANGKLCAEAEKIQTVIDDMLKQRDELDDIFQ